MLVVYASKTGNVKRFASKLGYRCVQIDPDLVVDEDFVLITYTTEFGKVPEEVNGFLAHHHPLMKGVAASGNRNWGALFAKSGITISSQYNVPLIHRFEMSGTRKDVEIFIKGVELIESRRVEQLS